ncbi:hypothetical protein CK203_044090 [Vitis vinifera]|uniref:Retrotransposon gag domain-containing protein n=1 Tax=Vitis vinifera TaxID=29760 RepID=A0A438HM48_VITVI|nr:hypothetical protein CK203_044090 [Vitis vinifera]
MRARLGPQELGKTRPPAATAWETHPDPLVTPVVQNILPHQAVQQAGRNSPNEPPLAPSAKAGRHTLHAFCSHIIHYDPPRGFLVPKFSTYDGSSDPFDHIMHYRQLMTLDIGNDALLCKDLSEAFVGQYLCSARHKQNISTLQNIKMQENESLKEFVKRFGQAMLQVEAYSMDAVLQIFKRSICPGTPFFESLVKKPPTTMDDLFRHASKYSMLEDDVRAKDLSEAFVGQYLCSARHKQNISTLQNIKMQENESLKEFVKRFGTPFFESLVKKPPTTMDDLFRHASKYSMLEDDVRAATQQILVAGKTSRSGAERSSKLQDRPRPSGRRWPGHLRADLAKRDHSKKCAYHKEHGHTTKTCRSLHYLVERLIKAGHLKQYLCSDARVRDTPKIATLGPLGS